MFTIFRSSQGNQSIMTDAHSNLRYWFSNSPSRREQATLDDTTYTNNIVNTFGLKWNSSKDRLPLPSSKPAPKQQSDTKRTVLQVSFKIYDPFGLLLPVTIRAKPTNAQVVATTVWVRPAPPTYPDRSCIGKKLPTTWRKQLPLPFPDTSFEIRTKRQLQPCYLSLNMPDPKPMELSPILPEAISALSSRPNQESPHWRN